MIIKSKYGQDVEVSHVVMKLPDARIAVSITATCGGSTHTIRPVYGAVDGKVGNHIPTTEELQALHDADRQYAADVAAWKEHVNLGFAGVK